MKGTEDVDLDDTPKVRLHFIRRVKDRCRPADAGVVDQHIEVSQTTDLAGNGVPVGDIALDARDLATEPGAQALRGVDHVCSLSQKVEIGSCVAECLGHGVADIALTACYQYLFAGKVESLPHGNPP